MKSHVRALLLVSGTWCLWLVGYATMVVASPVQWNLNGIQFDDRTINGVQYDDRTMATGWFIFDAESARLTNLPSHIETQAQGPFMSVVYKTSHLHIVSEEGDRTTYEIFFHVSEPGRDYWGQTLQMHWSISNTQTVHLAVVHGLEFASESDDDNAEREIIGGTIASTPVPLASSILLLGTGLAALAAFRKKVKK